MYSHHNRIKQRISNGELADWYYTKGYPQIGEAMVLGFKTEPIFRPVRPHRFAEYEKILGGMKNGCF